MLYVIHYILFVHYWRVLQGVVLDPASLMAFPALPTGTWLL
jgi:hypothetical protein